MNTDKQFINQRIATLYNEGKSYREIEDELLQVDGIKLSYATIGRRIPKLKKDGILDATTRDIQDEIIDDIKQLSGGYFRTGVLDIETTGLWADFGYVLCAVIRDLGTGKYDIFRLDKTKGMQDVKNLNDPNTWRKIDKELLELIRQAYEKYDLIIHFNGRNFDIKFLQTRMIKCGLGMLPAMKQLDIYQIAKHRLRLRSKRLDALKEFLDIDREQEGHRWEYWQMAGARIAKGYDFVVEHCKRDVDRLAEVAIAMKPFIDYVKK